MADLLLIEQLKSAEVVTDLDAIAQRFDAARKDFEAQRRGEAAMHTTVEVDRAAGTVSYRKNTTTPLLLPSAKSPSWNPEQLQALATKRGVVWDEKFAGRAVPYWASDQRVDSHGDIVLQNWTFDQFEKNPVMPWSHTWSSLPVGVAVDWQVTQRAESDYQGPALWLLGLFATQDMSDFADRAYRMVRSGFVRAGSVGFVSKKVTDIKDEEERAKLGLGRWGYVLDDNHLFEFSPCTLGANTGALTLLGAAKARGQLEAGDLDLGRELLRAQFAAQRDPAGWLAEDGKLLACARVLFPKADFAPRPKSLELPFGPIEDRVLRHYVPGATIAKDAGNEALLARLAALEEKQAAQDVVMQGLAERLEDVAQVLAVSEPASEDADEVEPVVEAEKNTGGLAAQIARAHTLLAGQSK